MKARDPKAWVVAGLGVLLALTAALPAPAAERGVTVYRDTWGVPHIYGETLGDAAYGMGYAQAEDRLADIYINVRTAVGSMAEAFGPALVERDYVMRLVDNSGLCEAYWKTAPGHLKEIGDNFMRGVEAYAAEHPEKKPPFAMPLYGWQCLAVQRAMILNWPLERLMDELHRKKQAPPFGSNSFAIAPSRSAEGCAVVMTDPHLTWEGLAVFYEARMHGGGHDLCGYWLVGSPMPALGHTKHVAWACTTGGPDTSDVYMVKLNPANPMQYQYGGEWRDFEVKPIRIPVQGQDPVEKPALYSLYGPVLEEPDAAKGVAYCGASPYIEAVDLLEQTHRMVAAQNADEFYEALSLNQFMEQNVTFADTRGNIRYVRVGCVPIRPEGDYDWTVPVPGGTDATRWKGVHGIADLVQVKNPPQGYFQNCNVSPELMMTGSPMTPDKYKKYIYDVTWDTMTPRGARLLELLAADESVTKEEAMEYTLDVYDILAKPWQRALKAAVDAQQPADAEVAKAVEEILAWDGRFVRESTVAPIVRYWRLACDKTVPVADIADGKDLPPAGQAKLVEGLAAALGRIESTYGKPRVAWGEINFIGRGGKLFGCPGTEFGGGGQKTYTETVMDVGTEEQPAGSGRYVATNGSSAVLLTWLRPDGADSYSVVNWGQSGDPASPHYVDQAEKLYAERKFKPTWFKKEDLLKHVESEKTLTF